MDSPWRPPRALRLAALVVVAGLALAACDQGPDPNATGPSGTTSGTTTGPTGSGPTTAPSPSTTGGTTTGPTTAPTSPAAPPDPRSVPVRSLLRPGTRTLRTLYGDLDGDGVDDIVLASVESHPPSGAIMAQTYLDVFRYDGEGEWPRAWEASEPAPPGNPQAPNAVLEKAETGQVSQRLEFLAIVDMAGDGSAELVVGVLNVGAGPGPLDLWVIAFGPEGAGNELWERTDSGGVLVVAGDTVRLQAPSYAPSDPACCPSRIEHQTIGWDSGRERVRVLHRSFTPVG